MSPPLKITNIVLNNYKHDSRVHKISSSLSRLGYNVTVVALHDFGQLEKEIVNTYKVHRVPLKSKRWPKKRFLQVFKYLEFLTFLILYYRNSDILHCNDLGTLPIGLALKLLNRNIKIVYDAHEYEPNCTPKDSKVVIYFKSLVENFCIQYANKVITVSESIALKYQKLYKIRKPSLILNCPVLNELPGNDWFRQEYCLQQNQKIFLYQGVFCIGRGLEIILQSFSKMDDQNVVVFMGYGPLKSKIVSMSKTHTNIFYHPAVLPDELQRYTASADFGLSLIEDTHLSYRYCLPNKFFEYVMAGLPVVISARTEMKKIVDRHQLGVVLSEDNSKDLTSAIRSILMLDYDKLKANVTKARELYTWEKQELVLKKIYHEL